MAPREESTTCTYHKDVERFMGEIKAKVNGLEECMGESKADRQRIHDTMNQVNLELKSTITRVGVILAIAAIVGGPIITAIIVKAFDLKGGPP